MGIIIGKPGLIQYVNYFDSRLSRFFEGVRIPKESILSHLSSPLYYSKINEKVEISLNPVYVGLDFINIKTFDGAQVDVRCELTLELSNTSSLE